MFQKINQGFLRETLADSVLEIAIRQDWLKNFVFHCFDIFFLYLENSILDHWLHNGIVYVNVLYFRNTLYDIPQKNYVTLFNTSCIFNNIFKLSVNCCNLRLMYSSQCMSFSFKYNWAIPIFLFDSLLI